VRLATCAGAGECPAVPFPERLKADSGAVPPGVRSTPPIGCFRGPVRCERTRRTLVERADVKFPGDLQSWQVKAHEIQVVDPGPLRLVRAPDDGVGRVVEALAAALALVALAAGPDVISAIPEDRVRGASGWVTPSGRRISRIV
jgi:hypothetical protein